jgi:ankyrin repeat protein
MLLTPEITLSITMVFKALLFLILFIFAGYIELSSYSHESREKPSKVKSFFKRSFRKHSVVACEDSFLDATTVGQSFDIITSTDSLEVNDLKLKCYWIKLPTVLMDVIFEYITNEYATTRLVSRQFRQVFDANIYRLAWQYFPRSNMQTFSKWSDTQSYKLINVVILMRTLLNSYPKNHRKRDLQSIFDVHYFSLTHRRFPLSFMMNDSEITLQYMFLALYRLLLARNQALGIFTVSTFLKMAIIKWSYIEHTIIRNFAILNSCWAQGSVTIARHLFQQRLDIFIMSVGPQHKGLLTAINNRKFELAKFMVDSLPNYDFSLNHNYLNVIIEATIFVEFWDLLDELYRRCPTSFNHLHLISAAKKGSVRALRTLSIHAKNIRKVLVITAILRGYSEFLAELHSMGLLVSRFRTALNESGQTAAHIAASVENLECLVYVLDQHQARGINLLKYRDFNGLLPIHLAAQKQNPNILLEIIRRYPSYSSIFDRIFPSDLRSPLEAAILSNRYDNVIILLNHFPKLIELQNQYGETAIHGATFCENIAILDLLLSIAPSYIIRATSKNGNTALHFAASNSRTDKIELLMKTGHFTGRERNINGHTAYFLYCMRSPLIQTFDRLPLFQVSSFEEMGELLRVVVPAETRNNPELFN